MDFFIVSLLNGVIYGLLLFMISAGLTLIFGMMGVLNFAHASFYMLGAYFAFALQPSVGFWGAVAITTLLVGGAGIVTERFFLRRVHRYGHAHELLLTFGLAFIIAELVKLFFGNFPVNYQVPHALRFAAFHVGPSSYPFYRLLIGAVAVVMFGLIYLLLRRTRVGIIVRAAIHRPSMAEALGHNVPVVFTLVFAIGTALAGLAGAIAGAFYVTSPNMASDIIVLVFVVVVIGGLGSLEGAMLASLLVGLVTAFSAGINHSLADLLVGMGVGDWIRHTGGVLDLTLSSLSGAIPYLLMLLVLLVRPYGLMGERD